MLLTVCTVITPVFADAAEISDVVVTEATNSCDVLAETEILVEDNPYVSGRFMRIYVDPSH